MSLLLVIGGAAVGAPLRYLSDRAIQSRHDTVFPWGTLAVNVIGSLILGVVTGAVTAGGASPQVQLAVGTGFCGALTTYSTFSYETLRLLEDDARLFAAANVVASIVAGLGAAFLGVAISQAIWS
ncbi:MAG: fluoride efflux transporter CrcB [Gemmatimonadota bacterium]|nr:fluoride efflux transporter CrcB [Gemmatimonadota bacterium]